MKYLLSLHEDAMTGLSYRRKEPEANVNTVWRRMTTNGEGCYYTVFQKKTPTHNIGYKLKNSCLILIIFDVKIPHTI